MGFQAGHLARALQASVPLSREIISLCCYDILLHALSYWIPGKATPILWTLLVSRTFCPGQKSPGGTHHHRGFEEHSFCAPMALGPDRGCR